MNLEHYNVEELGKLLEAIENSIVSLYKIDYRLYSEEIDKLGRHANYVKDLIIVKHMISKI